MPYKKIYIAVILFAMIVSSCFEEDERVSPYPGEVITIYDNIEFFQSYFDLETGEVVKSHAADLWQLGFECSDTGWHIIVNSGANWFIRNSEQTDMDASISSPESDLWAFDNQSAYPDSTAVGDWVAFSNDVKIYTNHIYFLGKYSSGIYSKIRRVQFTEVTDSTYRFIFTGTGDKETVNITKSDSFNFVYYSFDSGQQEYLESDLTRYDFQFAPYYDLVTQFGITIPYLVRGVLLNTTQTMAIPDSISTFEEIDFEKLDRYDFLTQRDVIGYQWKDANVNTSSGSATYNIKTHYNYIIKTSDNNYYKLRFLGYKLEGTNGHPKFEFKELKPIL